MNKTNLKTILYRLLGNRIGNALVYYKQYHKLPNQANPTLFNEKIQLLKRTAYAHNPIFTTCADKYKVREFLTSKGFEEILVPLIACYDSPEQVDFHKLPNRFVIKANFGNGMNIVVNDKNKENFNSITSKLKEWMKVKPELISGEMQYARIPKKIIVEENISEGNDAPIDYKFHCANGKCIMGFTVANRDTSNCSLYAFDADLNPIDYEVSTGKKFNYVNKAPEEFTAENVQRMMTLAERISTSFPYVRVDLFFVRGRIYFSELTFSEGGGFDKKTSFADKLLGDAIDLGLYDLSKIRK